MVAPGIDTPSVPAVMTLSSAAVELTAALQPLLQPGAAAEASAAAAAFVGADATEAAQSAGDWIINAYYTIQPWVEYGVQLFAWAFEWLPWPIGLLAPQAYIVYSGWQPFAESVAFSLAFLVDGQFDLVLPTLAAGIQTGLTNLVQGEIAWILSFFPCCPDRVRCGDRAGGRVAAAVAGAPDSEANGETPRRTLRPWPPRSPKIRPRTPRGPGCNHHRGRRHRCRGRRRRTHRDDGPSPRRASRAQRPTPAASAAAAVEEVSVPAADTDPARYRPRYRHRRPGRARFPARQCGPAAARR